MELFVAWCAAACTLVGIGSILKDEKIMATGGVMVLMSCAFAGD
jgi:hypothetical protein